MKQIVVRIYDKHGAYVNILLKQYLDGYRLNVEDVLRFVGYVSIPKGYMEIIHGLLCIPHGASMSYSEFAQMINKKCVRYIASLIGRNPLPIIVPCHRVIRKTGNLGNYIFGAGIKKELLDFESNKIVKVTDHTVQVVVDFYC